MVDFAGYTGTESNELALLSTENKEAQILDIDHLIANFANKNVT